MRLFGYYLGHTILNTIKKIFKTWLGIIIGIMAAACVLGGVIGFTVSLLEDRIQEETQEQTEQEVKEDADEAMSELMVSLGFDIEMTKEQITELVISGLFFFILFLGLLNSKGIGQIFLAADANLLFSAPIKPQSIMMFRLITTLGTQIFMSVFILFQLPNLILSLKFSVWGAFSVIIAWLMLVLFETLLQVLLYVISSYSEFVKNNLKILVGVFAGLIVAAFAVSVVMHDKNIPAAALAIFTGKGTYWIPFWGWMRGLCINAIAGNVAQSILYLVLLIAGVVAIIIIAWNLKADFYEDAMIAAERKAELQEKAKASKTGMVREKERSAKIKRDGFEKGSGANVFFHKTMYNRRRLSYFGALTKTMILYLAVAAAAIVISRVSDISFGYYIFCGIMVFAAFYRTLGNPLQEDLSKDFFAMIPASAREKLFYSLLGGVTNCLLDMVVPFVVVTVYFDASPLDTLLWMLFILTVDLYGTTIGSFVYVSISVNLAETVQRLVQVLFIYIGIMPALIFVLLGIIFKNMLLFMPFGILGNLLLTFLFFMLIPVFIERGRR